MEDKQKDIKQETQEGEEAKDTEIEPSNENSAQVKKKRNKNKKNKAKGGEEVKLEFAGGA